MAHAIGGVYRGAGGQITDANPAEVVLTRHVVGQPPTVLGNRHIEGAAAFAVVHQAHYALVQSDHIQIQVVVIKNDELAIRRPVQQSEIALFAQLQRLRFVQTILVAQHQHMAHACVRDVGHPLAVGAPKRVFFSYARCLRQIAHRAVFDGHGKNIAPRRDHYALAGSRQARRCDGGTGVFPLGAGLHGLGRHFHHNVTRSTGGHIEFLQAAAHLIDHGVAYGTGTSYVPYRLFGELFQRLGLRVIHKQVCRAIVAIRDKHDALADPQRIGVAGVHMGHLLPGVGHRVNDPNRRRVTATALTPACGA